MNEETIKEILMDIIINESTYTLEKIFEDEEFNKYRELALSNYAHFDVPKKLILKYGYAAANDTLLTLMDYRKILLKRQDEIGQLIEDLNAGYDADPESAPKELERMCDLCARAADYLGELV